MTWPEFLLAVNCPEFESNTGINLYDAETMAHIHGVRRLHPQADQPVCMDMDFDLCIQCDEHIPSDNVEFLALLHPDPSMPGSTFTT